MALQVPKRCDFCAHRLVDDVCKNEKCIDYTADTTDTTEEQQEERAK